MCLFISTEMILEMNVCHFIFKAVGFSMDPILFNG